MTLPDLVAAINANFNAVLQTAQSLRQSDNDSGLASPGLMTMGATNKNWLLPAGLSGSFIVIDYGIVLTEDQYTVADGVVTLNYTPAAVNGQYGLAVTWSASGTGVTPPVLLTVVPTLGPLYWQLPPGAGTNPLVFDHGRTLMRSEYTVEGDVIQLNNAPVQNPDGSYTISASWGASGPGVVPPVLLPMGDTNKKYVLPTDHGRTVVITDNGLVLRSDDFSVDLATGIVTLAYVPANTAAIGAFWGFEMDGVYLQGIEPTPQPDGTIKDFYFDFEPIVSTVLLKVTLANGTSRYYTQGTDFSVRGRRLRLNVAPPVGAILICSAMAVTLQQSLSATDLNGFRAVDGTAPGLGTVDAAGLLVALGPDGLLPSSVLPGAQNVDGFSAISSLDPRIGTAQAANYLPALGLDGRFDTRVLPSSPELGKDNGSTRYLNGVEISLETLTEKYEYNADGTLSKVSWVNADQVVVKTISLAYDADGRVTSRTDTAGGRLATRTYTYDNTGKLTSIAKVVS